MERCPNDSDACRREHALDGGAPFPIAIADQQGITAEHSINTVGEVAHRLDHERLVRMWCRAEHMDATRVQFDHEHRVVGHQSSDGPDFRSEEVRGPQCAPVGAQERAPRHRPLTAGRNALVLEDLGDRRAGNPMAEVLERSLDARIAPARIVSRHSNNQASDLNQYRGSARPLPDIGPFPRDQLAVSSENGVWRDESRDLSQHAPAESQPQHREPSALIVVQPKPSAAQLRLQRAVLFAEEGDHIALLALEPSKQSR